MLEGGVDDTAADLTASATASACPTVQLPVSFLTYCSNVSGLDGFDDDDEADSGPATSMGLAMTEAVLNPDDEFTVNLSVGGFRYEGVVAVLPALLKRDRSFSLSS